MEISSTPTHRDLTPKRALPPRLTGLRVGDGQTLGQLVQDGMPTRDAIAIAAQYGEEHPEAFFAALGMATLPRSMACQDRGLLQALVRAGIEWAYSKAAEDRRAIAKEKVKVRRYVAAREKIVRGLRAVPKRAWTKITINADGPDRNDLGSHHVRPLGVADGTLHVETPGGLLAYIANDRAERLREAASLILGIPVDKVVLWHRPIACEAA